MYNGKWKIESASSQTVETVNILFGYSMLRHKTLNCFEVFHLHNSTRGVSGESTRLQQRKR